MFALLRVITDVTIAGEIIYLDSLDLSKMRQGWGKPQVNRSIRETQLSIAGQKFERGVGTHSKSVFWLNLAGETERFISRVGVDDAAGGNPSIVFKIFGDGKKLFDSGLMKLGDKPKEVDISLDGIKTLLLLVEDGGDGISFDHADWADARFIVRGKKPEPIEGPPEP
ncbi:MAG: NPCBM/NEW2 domain-containing protein, partial [Limisphaerales bacterium]